MEKFNSIKPRLAIDQPVENIKPPIPSTGKQDDRSQYIRCPIPPIGLGPTDNLRQFYNGGTVPIYRTQMNRSVLPSGNSGGGSSTSVTNVVSTSSSSGGGGSPTNGIYTTSLTSPSLNQNQTFTGSLIMARTYVVLNVTVSTAARVRLYNAQSYATADASRNTATPISLGLMNGIVGDWLLQSSSEYNWNCSPAPVGYNADSPSSSVAYINVTNPASSSNIIQVTITYASLEK